MTQEIVVDFEAFPPQPEDFQGIKKLLNQLFLRQDVNTSDLANIVIESVDLTTIVKQSADDEDEEEDCDDDVYGLFSLIDLGSNNQKTCIDTIRKFIVNQAAGDEKFSEQAKSAMVKKPALVLNERFINLPARVSVPSFQSLAQDLKQKPELDFDHFFMVIKIQKAVDRHQSHSVNKKKDKEKNKRQKVDQEQHGSGANSADDAEDILFQNPEEEIFCEKAVQFFEFSVANQCDADVRSGNWDEEDVKYHPFRRILLLDRRRFLQAIEVLVQEFSSS